MSAGPFRLDDLQQALEEATIELLEDLALAFDDEHPESEQGAPEATVTVELPGGGLRLTAHGTVLGEVVATLMADDEPTIEEQREAWPEVARILLENLLPRLEDTHYPSIRARAFASGAVAGPRVVAQCRVSVDGGAVVAELIVDPE
jgi:hypothetical protein